MNLTLPSGLMFPRRAKSAPGRRRLVSVFSVLAAVVAAGILSACSQVDSQGTIPRSHIRVPRSAHRLTVINEMIFEHTKTAASRNTVTIPAGEYAFEAEDDIYLYFRSPEPLEYRMYRSEGFADAMFQNGGIALARKSKWDTAQYPACTYTDGKKQNQKRLTCPLSPPFLMQKRGSDWESDFDEGN